MSDPAPQSEGSLAETTPLQTPSSSSTPSVDEGHFLPGAVLAKRYRIISLLGRGGMGEVYRATDLLLGQPVALKFLPPAFARNEEMLARFRNEVRISRQVSHPNVCRVYDIGEAEGLVFISMEYVDGEDLASLLRRIGHLPQDKALEVVRQLCEGLAAAHDKGVIHRDLKPANIMLDGHGQVRVMDFGLAVFAEQAMDVRSGTPAYLAPEQKSGREVTARSDIYALGIMVHEIYTGTRPAEKASSKVELEPAVASVIERCLAEDPQKRPASALAVVASLPGGDPLAAALAAGETPSPEMVANAGPVEGMSVGWATACLALAAAGLVALLFLSPQRRLTDMIPAPESPEVLAGRARDYIRSFGYTSPPNATAMGWEFNVPYLTQLWEEKGGTDLAGALRALQPPAVTFWYRQHPLGMFSMLLPEITRSDPWFNPESIEVVLDPQGRLVELHAAPKERKAYQSGPSPDWGKLFAAAGLDMAKFEPAGPQFVPRTAYDRRQAWKGSYPSPSGTEVHVEAAGYEGKVSSFRVVSPRYLAGGPPPTTRGPVFALVFFVIVPLVAVVMAWSNVARSRADWNGALRLGLFCFGAMLTRGLLVSHFTAGLEGPVIWKALREASFSLFFMTVLYLAFEPYVRRRMPHALVSWSRILEGRWRDARVGADFLTGVVTYAVPMTFAVAIYVFWKPYRLHWLMPELVVSGSDWLAAVLSRLIFSVGGCMSFLLLLAAGRFLLRRTWIAAAVLTAVLSLVYSGGSMGLHVLGVIMYSSLFFFLLARHGLVSAIAFTFTYEMLSKTVCTTDFSRWYAWQGICTVLVLMALCVYAFWANLGGRPLWREED